MPKPIRIQLSRAKGWRMPPNTVKVDRTTKWGNPFVVGEHGTRAECVDLFAMLCAGRVCLSHGPEPDIQLQYIHQMHADMEELRGKNLACWCPPDAPCHADRLLKLANRRKRGITATVNGGQK